MWAVTSAVIGMVCWVAWLPWHAAKQVSPTGTETGPYTPHQVMGLILSVCLVALVGGWFKVPLSTGCGLAVGMTVMFSADAITQVTDDASIWPVGAAMLLVGATVGLCIVAYASLVARFGISELMRWRLRHTQ